MSSLQPISGSRAIATIFRKEVIDNMRDRRTITTMLVSMLMGPVLLIGMMWFAESKVKEETDLVSAQAIEVPVIGAQYAPNLVDYLAKQNIKVVAGPSDPRQSISDGTHRVVLEIGDEFGQQLRLAKPAPVRLYFDSSVAGLEQIAQRQVESAIQMYSQTIAAMRLQTRGVSPSIMQPVVINTSDVANPEARNAQILSMVPYIVIFSIMIGGMYLAIDTTAGEREKGSLEPLLAQPIDRSYLVLGKLFATALFSAATFLLVLVSFGLSFAYAPVESMHVALGVDKIAFIFLICLPFVFLGVGAEIVLASFTKSFKEAQSYMGMVMLVPTLPLMLLVFLSPEPSMSNMWIPSFSQGLMIVETIKGESIATPLIALSMASSLALAVVFALTSIWLYRRERILG